MATDKTGATLTTIQHGHQLPGQLLQLQNAPATTIGTTHRHDCKIFFLFRRHGKIVEANFGRTIYRGRPPSLGKGTHPLSENIQWPK